MATTISKLAIKLVADANGVRTGTLGAEGHLTRLSQRVDALATKAYGGLKTAALSTFGQMVSAQAAISLATQAWHASVERVGQAYDDIAERSRRARQAGAETQDLGRIEFIAKMTTNLNEDAVWDSIRAMQKRIGDASMDAANPLNKTFEKLGLDADELMPLSTIDRFFAIADAIGGIQDASQRSAMTAALFEETGSAWATAFAAGGQAIRGFATEYDRIHGIVTADDAKRVEEYQRAIVRLTTAIDGLFEKFAAENADKLTEAVESLLKLTVAVAGVVDDVSPVLQGVYVDNPLSFSGSIVAAGRLAGWWQEIETSSAATAGSSDVIRKAEEDTLAVSRERTALAEARQKAEEAAVQAQRELLDAQLEAMNSLVDQADQLRESLKDPFEKLQDEIQGARRLLLHGLITEGEFDEFSSRQGQQLLEQIQADAGRDGASLRDRFDTRGTGSVVAGSQAALSAIAANERGIAEQAKRDQLAARQRDRLHVELRRIRTIVERAPGPTLLAGELR